MQVDVTLEVASVRIPNPSLNQLVQPGNLATTVLAVQNVGMAPLVRAVLMYGCGGWLTTCVGGWVCVRV